MRARLILFSFCALSACRMTGETPRERNEEINRNLLERLSGEALTPVKDFDEESYFDELERLYADAPVEPPKSRPELDPEPDMNPYLVLGANIWPVGEGFFVKHYSFPKDMGASIQQLALIYADFPVIQAIDGGGLPAVEDQAPEAAVLDLRPGYDAEAFNPPRNAGITRPNLVPLADWILVRARPEVMVQVERFFDLFAAERRQIEIEAKIVEVTTSDSTDWGIRPIDSDTPIFDLPNSGSLVNEIGYSFGNTVDASEALFGVTSVFDGVRFNAMLELVAEHENVSIISRPKVAVREGARAEIVNTTSIPFFQIKAINAAGNFTTQLAFQDVGTQMYIVPRVIGEDTIILNIDIAVSQETGTAVTFAQGGDGAIVSVPEISTRIARTIVRLQPGQAVILGGLISERTASRETRIPVLADVPLLGYLFRNEFRVKEQTNVLFFIRPRILQGIDFQDF
jgi:type II secretory pathway component GspD/PulD (secretin)